MATYAHPIQIWVKTFKSVWLPKNIPDDVHLREAIIAKLAELEELINDDYEDEEQYHRAKLLNDVSSDASETEQIDSPFASAHESPPDNHLQSNSEPDEEHARRVLLEESDHSNDATVFRPAIRLKRISQADAERYIPLAWREGYVETSASVTGVSNNQKTSRQTEVNTNDVATDSTASEVNSRSESQVPSNQVIHASSMPDGKTSKRKSRTSDNDQLSTPSKTSSTSNDDDDDDDDFTIKLRTRKSVVSKTHKVSSAQRRPTRSSHGKKEVIINYGESTTLNPTLSDGSLSTAEHESSTHEDGIADDVTENHDHGAISSDAPSQETPMEINENNNNTEEVPNGIIDASPMPVSENEDDDRPPVNVPSYGHLVAQSNLSDSGDEDPKEIEKKKGSSDNRNQSNSSKRLLTSSPNSDISPVKKKSKRVIKQRADLSLSSSDHDNDTDSTSATSDDITTKRASSSSRRIRIQRSSSEESNNSEEIISSRSRERSRLSKDKKRKAEKARSPRSTDTTDDDRSTRKRSKSRSNADEEEEDDEEEISPSKGKHGRKNIRKIIDDKELDVHTKDAIEAEQERRKRIAEKQKEYNETLLEQSSLISTEEAHQTTTTNRRLVLELDKTTNEPLIEVAPDLVEQLKPHQCDGVRFLWNNVFESIEAIQKKKHQGNGCILAHCMGLGKTLQIISFIHTVFNYDKITNVKTCLVLCPINAALNWSNEFEHWLTGIEPSVDHYQLTTVKPNLRASYLNYWYANGGVIVMGYEMYRRLANGFGIKNKKAKTDAYRCLVDPGPDIVVADEGHILKNAQTALAKCLSKIKTRRRIVLTGTPLQNNLIEYYCMVSFIKPSLLGSQSEYINRFVNPIQNGQHRDSNEDDVRLMKRRACVLHGLLTGFVDRKDYSLLKEYLPPKLEYIINIRLSDLQSQLYETYLKKQVNQEQRSSVLKKDFKSAKLFADYQFLQKIWTHPFLLYPHFIDRWKKRFNAADESNSDDLEMEAMFTDEEENAEGSNKKKQKKPGQRTDQTVHNSSYSGFLIDNIDPEIKPPTLILDEPPPSNSSSTATIDSVVIESDDSTARAVSLNSDSEKSNDELEVIRTYPTRSRATISNKQKTTDGNVFDTEDSQVSAEEPTTTASEPWLNEMREQFWFPFLDALPEEDRFNPELSGKFLILKFILEKCHEIGDKVLLFSRSIYTLNHIEKFLNHLQIENQKEYQKQCDSRRQLRELLSSSDAQIAVTDEPIPEPIEWVRDRDYFRMDGHTDVTMRKRCAKAFNDTSNIRSRLFLISTLAGGIGINLTGSNRVIVFDASWNPSHDTQAIFRSYRFGQKKPVYIYRFLAHGTMEEKIYQRQVVKQSMSQRVVDDHQLDRHFTQNDIKELYKFQPEKLPEARSASALLSELEKEVNYPLPKDHLLLDLLCQHNRWVQSYHSHDSLLENKLDEGLTDDERRKALEEYENLKRLPDQRQLALERFQQQQRLNALIAQQQHMAAAQGTRIPQANVDRFLQEIRHSLQLPGGIGANYDRLLQHIQNNAASMGFSANNRNNHAGKPMSKRVQNPTVPIQPRPPMARPTTTANNPNQVIFVDSDVEPDNNPTSSTSK